MKNVITIISLLISVHTSAQKNNIDYDFMAKALTQVTVIDKNYIQLRDYGYPCILSTCHYKSYRKQLKKKIDTLSLRELINNSNVEVSSDYKFKLRLSDLNKSIILISANNIDSLQHRKVEPPLNKRYFYISSIPVFDNRFQYAVIAFGGGTTMRNMQGQKYLFKKSGNNWKLVAVFDNWIS